MNDIKEIMEGIGYFKSVLSTIKEVITIWPKSKEKQISQSLQEISTRVQLAEVQLAKAELQLAKGLGYELCKCTWPPQIMLFTGEAQYGEKFRCPACGRETSPDDDTPPPGNWRSI